MAEYIELSELQKFCRKYTEYDAVQLILNNRTDLIPTADAIEIPKGATNGDVIIVMFPNANIIKNKAGYMVNVKYNNHTCWVNYELDWWNAPYGKE